MRGGSCLILMTRGLQTAVCVANLIFYYIFDSRRSFLMFQARRDGRIFTVSLFVVCLHFRFVLCSFENGNINDEGLKSLSESLKVNKCIQRLG